MSTSSVAQVEPGRISPGQINVDAFAEKVLGDYAGANAFFMAGIGDRLGLFKELASDDPATSAELARRTGLDERYLREWLAGMAAAGYLSYDPCSGRYAVPDTHLPVLAEEEGPYFFGAAFYDYSLNFGDTFQRLIHSFRTGGGVPQEAYGEEGVDSIERFTAPWFEHQLLPNWIPAMPRVQDLLQGGAAVCDVGCGRGRALIKLARAYPTGRYVGLDISEPSIRGARAKADKAGVTDRVQFRLTDAALGLPGRFDLITTFDVLHDAADPAALLREIHRALVPGGRYVCLDINCADRPENNTGPLGTVLYGLSLAYCLTVSLASGGEGLGTLGLPPSKLNELAVKAGFSDVRQVPIGDPFNNLYELTP